ncbi:MAG: hypothetical protein Q9227_006213 [Pyrenula ochraceoflavens]
MLYLLGLLTASYALYRVINIIWAFLRPSSISRCLRKDGETWALVTGASDGIGFAFCQELASRDFNIVLHGRNPQKLEAKAAELLKDFPHIQTRLFVADASAPVNFGELQEIVKDIHLTVLVNNVGGTGNQKKNFMPLQDFTVEDIDSTVNINALFATKITHFLLPSLLKNEPSLILNVGSTAASGFPQLSVYAGTKGYLMSLSESLQNELVDQRKDVTVHTVLIAAVQAGNIELEKSVFVPSARAVARATIDKVGCGEVVITPWLPHAMQTSIMGSFPTKLRRRALIGLLRMAENAERKNA